MKSNRKASIALTAAPEAIHLATVQAFVTHHCQDFSWSNNALGFIRARDYSRLLSLAESVEEDLIQACSGDPSWHTEYASASAFARGMQFAALITKYKFHAGSIPGLDPEGRAKEDFLRAERRNRRLNIVFRCHRERGTDRHWSVAHVRKTFLRVLGDTPFYERIFDKCDFSGGASVGHTGKTTHLAAKLGGEDLHGGMSALAHFELALWRNQHYRLQFLEHNGDYHCVDRERMISTVRHRFRICEYNKIEVVTKKARSGRTIAKEPEVNNFMQKGPDLEIRSLLRERLGIDLSHQEPNQRMARRGASQWEDADPEVTLDVKGASNSVLTEAIRSVSPPRWFHLLDQLRSKEYELDGVVRRYEMFCSMGNGFCFPLETLLFAAICDAAYKYAGLKPDYRCYGDDIVVRRSVALVVIECLNAFGFRLNISKSYVHGPFRESCGANSYGGLEVTPGYYKDPVTTPSELYARHNTLSRWPKVQAVMRGFMKTEACFVPNTPTFSWVTDQAFVVPLDLAMGQKGVFWSRRLQSWQAVHLSTRPKADANWQKSFHGQSVEGMILTAVLRGAPRADEPFHLRFSTRTVKVRSDAVSGPKACIALAELHNAHVVQWAQKVTRTMAHLRRPLRAAVEYYRPALVTGLNHAVR